MGGDFFVGGKWFCEVASGNYTGERRLADNLSATSQAIHLVEITIRPVRNYDWALSGNYVLKTVSSSSLMYFKSLEAPVDFIITHGSARDLNTWLLPLAGRNRSDRSKDSSFH